MRITSYFVIKKWHSSAVHVPSSLGVLLGDTFRRSFQSDNFPIQECLQTADLHICLFGKRTGTSVKVLQVWVYQPVAFLSAVNHSLNQMSALNNRNRNTTSNRISTVYTYFIRLHYSCCIES